jgi:hypothetical protein
MFYLEIGRMSNSGYWFDSTPYDVGFYIRFWKEFDPLLNNGQNFAQVFVEVEIGR